MGVLRDWPSFMLLVDTAEDVAAYREQGLGDVEDMLKTENPHNNEPFAVSDSHVEDEQPKNLTADDLSMPNTSTTITIFGTDIICMKESKADQQVPCSKKEEERVDGLKRCLESSESSSPKKPKTQVTCDHQLLRPSLPETFEEMIQGLDGSGEKLILQKTLEITDLSKHHGGLSAPLNQVMTEFLTDEEKNVLEQGSKRGTEALVIDPGLKKMDEFETVGDEEEKR